MTAFPAFYGEFIEPLKVQPSAAAAQAGDNDVRRYWHIVPISYLWSWSYLLLKQKIGTRNIIEVLLR